MSANKKTLVELLKRIRRDILSGRYDDKKEAMVKSGIIEPILRSLGWNTEDMEQVELEYSLRNESGGRGDVDYALLDRGNLFVVIEAKAYKRAGGAEPQLFGYVYDAGALLALLTDGGEWRVYLTFRTGGYKERLVRNINIVNSEPEESAEYLWRYLSHQEVISQRAQNNARQDLEERTNREEARRTIPDVWKEMVEKETTSIIDELIDEVAKRVGNAPSREDIVNFLKSLRPQPSSQPSAPLTEARVFSPRKIDRPGVAQEEGQIFYILWNEKHIHRQVVDAFVEILRRLDNEIPNFMEQFALRLRRRRTNCPRREKQDHFRQPRQIGDWHMDTHSSTQDKVIFLMEACKVAGIEYGKDLIVNFPSRQK